MTILNQLYIVLVLFILSISALFLVSQNPHHSQSKLQTIISQCEELKNYRDTLKIIKKWKITNWSYESLLTNNESVFTYLDPPYDIGSNLYGRKGSMHNGSDHDSFARDCSSFTGAQLVSYNSSNLIRERFQGWQTAEFDLTYTMRSVGEYMREQKERKELLLLNYEESLGNLEVFNREFQR